MTAVTVVPERFTLVEYDADRISAIAASVASIIGLPPDIDVHVEVDERSMLGRVWTQVDSAAAGAGSRRLVRLRVEGAAFEDIKHPRRLSEDAVRATLARVLFRVADRLLPAFAAAPPDDGLDLRQQTAWDAYSMGRAERLDLPAQKARRLYHFRNRHGFSDASDTQFERLWRGVDLGWEDIEAACREAASAGG